MPMPTKVSSLLASSCDFSADLYGPTQMLVDLALSGLQLALVLPSLPGPAPVQAPTESTSYATVRHTKRSRI